MACFRHDVGRVLHQLKEAAGGGDLVAPLQALPQPLQLRPDRPLHRRQLLLRILPALDQCMLRNCKNGPSRAAPHQILQFPLPKPAASP